MENSKSIPYTYWGVKGYLTRLDWDIIVGDTPYFGYRFSPDLEYYEKETEKLGDLVNNYDRWFVCERDCPEDKIIENLVLADKKDMGVRWKFEIEDTSYVKTKWEDSDLRTNCKLSIYRNNKLFYSDLCGDYQYGIARAQQLIQEWNNHPLWLHEIDFDKKMVGRKVYFRDDPAIIDHFCWGDADVWLVPDKEAGCEKFKKPAYEENDHDDGWPDTWYEYEDGLRVPLTSKDIWWFRD